MNNIMLGLYLLACLLIGCEARADTAVATTQPTVSEADLDIRVDDIDLNGKTVDEALVMLSDKTHLNLVADWSYYGNGLTKADRTAKVTFHLRDTSTREVIAKIIKSAGAKYEPSFEFSGNVIYVRDDDYTYLKLYNVARLLTDIDQKIIKKQKPSSLPVIDLPESETAEDYLCGYITENVSPGTWRIQGGVSAGCWLSNGKLLIQQSAVSHQLIEKALKDMESMNAK